MVNENEDSFISEGECGLVLHSEFILASLADANGK